MNINQSLQQESENSILLKAKKKLKTLNLILLEQSTLLFNITDQNLIKLISCQNAIFAQSIFSQNYNDGDDFRLSFHNVSLFEKRFKELSDSFPSYYFSVPYLIIYELNQIKEHMQSQDSSFDNTPEDIDACLKSLETKENISDSFNNLDQYTRQYLSEPTYKYIKHFLV